MRLIKRDDFRGQKRNPNDRIYQRLTSYEVMNRYLSRATVVENSYLEVS